MLKVDTAAMRGLVGPLTLINVAQQGLPGNILKKGHQRGDDAEGKPL